MKEQQPSNNDGVQRLSEHPPLAYSIWQAYSIRKQSINSSNDQIYKKLSRQFQRIKKLRSQSANLILAPEYDYDNNSNIKKDFRRLHDTYNTTTKANTIVKRRIDKMRTKVDQIKSEVERDELNSIKEVDISKIINKSIPQSNGTQQAIKTKQER